MAQLIRVTRGCVGIVMEDKTTNESVFKRLRKIFTVPILYEITSFESAIYVTIVIYNY